MTNHFWVYEQPSEDFFKTLWDEAVFVLDTNVLLNIHRLKRESAEAPQSTSPIWAGSPTSRFHITSPR